METPLLRTLLDFAIDAAWQAGRITLGYFQTALTIERKSDNSPVTIADRQAEQKLRELISRSWPEHSIIGEEYGEQVNPGNLRWLIDPIDGTESFIHGVPIYGTLLALTDESTSLVGVMHFPALGETVCAARGQGCYWNGRRTQVSSVSKLSEATLLGSSIRDFARLPQANPWPKLVGSVRTTRTWGDSYGYALVATGRAEIMMDPIMALWDCGPLQVILEEAGGTFTDWQGNPALASIQTLATNGVLFDQVMAVLAGQQTTP